MDTPIKTLKEFFAEAERTGLTAHDILDGMKERERISNAVKALAEQAGFPDWWLNPPEPERKNGEAMKLLEKFSQLVIEAERERLAEQFAYDSPNFDFVSDWVSASIQDYIRSGGVK
jgi:hypothetical protein